MFKEEVADEDRSAEIRKEYSTVRTENALFESGIKSPDADSELFYVYFLYLQRSGLLAKPIPQNNLISAVSGKN